MIRYMAKYRTITTDRSLADVVAIAKALADESRVRIVARLLDGELCLCQLIDILDLAPSTVSKHISVLRAANLVEQRKEGRWHFYRLPVDRKRTPLVRQAIKWVAGAIADDSTVAADASRLKALAEKPPTEWTKCYRPASERCGLSCATSSATN